MNLSLRLLTASLLTAVITLTVLPSAHAEPTYEPVDAAVNHQRDGLGHVLAKLDAGKEVRIGYLGGSITAQSGWRVQTLVWLKEQYPDATISEINAAIGGTGSDLGVFRLQHDALRHKPDLLFVEFAVNDGGAPPERIWQAMEGIVRQTWAAIPDCDICFVYTFRTGYENDLRQGKCPRAASADEMLAEHYGIPSINMALRTVQLESEGKLVFKGEKTDELGEGVVLFSTDGVHPLDAGHRVYTDVIAEAITQWRASGKPPVDHAAKLDNPFVADHWQAAKMEPLRPVMLSGGWTKLDPTTGLGSRFGGRMDTIWLGEKPGQTIAFRFRGSAVKLYDLLGPDGGQAIVTVDGVTQDRPRPRFDSYCTYHRLATLSIAEGLDPNEVHTIKIEIHPDQPDRTPVAFRLKNPEEELKAEKFQGTRMWVGGILLIGELVE